MCELWDKSISDISLIKWQYQENSAWKNFDEKYKDDNKTLENAYQTGKSKVKLEHGYYQTYEIDLKKKTSKKVHYGNNYQVRRWVKFTPKQLHQRKIDGVRQKFLSRNQRAASKLWKTYYEEGAFDFSRFLVTDLGFADQFESGVLVLFWKCECVPATFTEQSLYLGLAQLNNSTSVKSVTKEINKELGKLKTNPKYMDEFYNWCFHYCSNFKDAVKVEPAHKENLRIDESDGEAYDRASFDEVYGADSAAMWKAAEAPLLDGLKNWFNLIKLAGMNDIKLVAGQPPLGDAWAQFFTERPKEFFTDGRAESVGEDEWATILDYMRKLKFNFEDFDEYTAPSLVSDFKRWFLAKKVPDDDVVTSGGQDDTW